jgi:hypothetical protein
MVGREAELPKPAGSEAELREVDRGSLKGMQTSEDVATEPYVARVDDASGNVGFMQQYLVRFRVAIIGGGTPRCLEISP